MSNQKVIEKVKKLLSLHNNNTSLNEASNAYKVAQKLLAEHRLSMADIESASDLKEENIGVSDHCLYEGKRRITWRVRLASIVARNNGCDVLLYGGNIRLVGRDSDFVIVKWLYDSIETQIEAMAKHTCKGMGKGYSNDFKLGAVSRVAERLAEAKQETRDKYSGTKALVLVDQKDAAIKKYVKDVLKVTSSHTGGSAKRREAFNRGQQAGNKVNLSKGGLNTANNKGLLN